MKNEIHIRKAIAGRLKEWKKEKGYTEREAAKIFHVNHKRFASFLEARAKPDLQTLMLICDELDLTIEELITPMFHDSTQ